MDAEDQVFGAFLTAVQQPAFVTDADGSWLA